MILLSQICKDVNISTREARKILRKSGIKRPNTPIWVWSEYPKDVVNLLKQSKGKE